ncbi:MAG: hypothetical protein OXE53_21755 [Deltaproteobacteria bacterium]|nr:hypothetical protein [Deltaproteobacteria bacterium]
MKLDIHVPSIDGVVRVEIRSVEDGDSWSAYLVLIGGASLADACLVLARSGLPIRFGGESAEAAETRAKEYAQAHYRVARMIW